MAHTYLRIVHELQRRIAVGELRPGDRVPSTRQITQEWGVAMATATKVLNTLRQEGLVRAVQGVGTVVEDPGPATRRTPQHEPTRDHTAAQDPGLVIEDPGPAARRQQELTRDRIVATGIRIADADGLAGVSMRRVATDLGTATMSLYRHVPGKDDLVVLMADRALTEEPLPAEPPSGWRAQLELVAHLQWRAVHRHPWLPGAISLTRPQAMPNAMRHTEWSLRALAGLPPKTMLYAYLTLLGFVRGAAVGLEAETRAEQDTGMTADEWTDSQDAVLRPLLTADLPALTELTSHDIDFDIDELFEFGLQRLLDGLAPLFAHRGGDTAS